VVDLDAIGYNKNPDNRPFADLNFSKYGCQLNLNALLDSGSARTIVGSAAWELLKPLGVKCEKVEGIDARAVNGTKLYILGSVRVTLVWGSYPVTFDAFVIPSVETDVVLGFDFWKKVGVVLDSEARLVHFRPDNEAEKVTVRIRCGSRKGFGFHAASFRYDEKEGEFKGDDGLGIEIPVISKPAWKIEHSELSEEQKIEVISILDEAFEKAPKKLGKTNVLVNKLKLVDPNTEPVMARQYPLPHTSWAKINKTVDTWLENGIIRPSDSPWRSPLLLVNPTEGKDRTVLDLRRVNEKLENDAYPQTHMNTIFTSIVKPRFISKFDLKSAFLQIPLSEESCKYTAFGIPGRGLFEFTVTPFGIKTGCAIMQRLMDRLFGVKYQPYIFTYLDDLVCVSDDYETHLKLLQEILEKFREANLMLNFEKCQFFVEETEYLGYKLCKEGISPLKSKVEVILNFPVPNTKRKLRRWIGVCSWYRQFIPHFAEITAPLTKLTSPKSVWKWTDECMSSFETLKKAMTSAPILANPTIEGKYVLEVDASDRSLGAVLKQEQEEVLKVIAYASRTLSDRERKFTTTEKECLAVLWGIHHKFRQYLLGRRFTVRTDHMALRWLHNLKDPTGRLARWALTLQEYPCDIVHHKGTLNVTADLLSRVDCDGMEVELGAITTGEEEAEGEEETRGIEEDDATDDWYESLKARIQSKPQSYQLFKVEDGKIFRSVGMIRGVTRYVPVVPKEERTALIRSCHEPAIRGHGGVFKTFKFVQQLGYWPRMYSDVSKFVSRCGVCVAAKAIQEKKVGEMLSHQTTRPWETLSLDLMGPYPRTSNRNRFVLTITDLFTKWSFVIPVGEATASVVCGRFEKEVLLNYGACHTAITDNGTQFTSRAFQALLQKYGIKHLKTPYYHAQANPVERNNRTTKQMIRCYVQQDHKKWDRHLSEIQFALRTSTHESTGFSPSRLMFNREMYLSGAMLDLDVSRVGHPSREQYDELAAENHSEIIQLQDQAQALMRSKQAKNKAHYDLRRRASSRFELGNLVWRTNHVLSDAAEGFSASLAPKRVGPFVIKSRLGSGVFTLEDLSGKSAGTWHVSDLKHYGGDGSEES